MDTNLHLLVVPVPKANKQCIQECYANQLFIYFLTDQKSFFMLNIVKCQTHRRWDSIQ